MKRRYTLVFLLCIAALLAVTGCGTEGTTEGKTESKTPVSIQMAWVHEYSAAGLYAAEKNGHNAEQGLDVTLSEGGFGENGYIEPIEVVVNGTYDFGLTSAEALIHARADGEPVVAIATLMQRSPSAIISLEESNILRPQDLSGHTIQVADGGALNLFNALLKSQNIDPATVNTLPRAGYGAAPLLNRETDALYGWIINEGVEVKEAGETPIYLLLSDYGIDSYSIVLFTTETTIQEKPELVEKVTRSLLNGFRDVIANPTQAINYTLEYDSSLDSDGQLRRLQAMIPLINVPGKNLGTMDAYVWEDTQTIMLQEGSLDIAIDLNTVYTTVFLDKIYGQ